MKGDADHCLAHQLGSQ